VARALVVVKELVVARELVVVRGLVPRWGAKRPQNPKTHPL
jgi:hypothetical protein